METRANYALIGLFTLLTVAAALGFVIWFARLAGNNVVDHYRIIFSGSVSGLTPGSSVLFNGLRVGQVDDLELAPNDPAQVIGLISVKQGTPVKQDTRARMELQGLTGGANVLLYGGSGSSSALASPEGNGPPTIYAERSDLQNLVDGARDTIQQASHVVTRLDQFLAKNDASVTDTLSNVRNFTKALSDNSGNVADFLSKTGGAAQSIQGLADDLRGMTGDLKAIVASVDRQKVDRIMANIEKSSQDIAAFTGEFKSEKARQALDQIEQFTQTLAKAREPLDSLVRDASSLAGQLDAMAPKLASGLDEFQRVMSAVDSQKVASVVDNVQRFSATIGQNSTEIDQIVKNTRDVTGQLKDVAPGLAVALQSFNRVASSIDPAKVDRVMKNVDDFAASLGASSDKVNAFMNDARDVGRKLNAAADQLEGILKNVDAMTRGTDGQGMFKQISDAAQSIRTLAQNLDQRTAVLSANLNKFTGSGLREYSSLAQEGQKTLQSLQRVLNSLQRNPQQLILGPKSSIPDFKGR